MPFSRGSLNPLGLCRLLLVLLVFLGAGVPAFAIEEGEPLHFSGDRQLWDRRLNKVELIGHAVVNQPHEKLNADYAMLDLNARTVDAKGNCVYFSSDVVIYAEEMHFNLDTHTGTIIGGRVSHDRFTLSGERINKLGDGRFQTHWGEYTTCRDCPRSWSFQAKDVDLEVEGYAYITDITAKIFDAPTLWLPYLIFPMKSKRQSGFLFPRTQLDGNFGFIFVEPYFWAISRSADMTVGLGTFTERGRRAEWEGRYVLGPRDFGTSTFLYTHDSKFPDRVNRWAFNLEQQHELPWTITEKLRIAEVSDNNYPVSFAGDSSRGSDLVLRSDLLFNFDSSDVSAYLLATRYRNVFPTNPISDPSNPDTTQQKLDFDPKTVQALPKAVVTTNDKFFFGSPLATGLTLGIANFTRTGESFDYDSTTAPANQLSLPVFKPGIDPIRKATRLSVTPSVYTTVRPFDLFSIVPSAQYRSFFYNFHNEVGIPNLVRGYLLTQIELSTQLERIFDFPDDPAVPRTKHLIRPILTYSRIPYVREDAGHPFLKQIQYAQGKPGLQGYNFDDNDIVPIHSSPTSTNYFVPLGNSLTYGMTTQWIRRRSPIESEVPSYQTSVEVSAGQAVDFLEFQDKTGTDPLNPRYPFSRFFSNMNLAFDRWNSGTTYFYYPYAPGVRHKLSTSAAYVFERATHQKFLSFDRSVYASFAYDKLTCVDPSGCGSEGVSLGMSYSINDYLTPSISATHDLVGHVWQSAETNLLYQNLSQCWKVNLRFAYALANKGIGAKPTNITFDLTINLTGSGYMGMGELTQQAAAGH